MVSPRKRMDLLYKGSPDEPLLPREDTKRDPKVCSVSKPRKSMDCVFAKKKFFLDLKPKTLVSPVAKQIAMDLKTLGGTIEDFFSREVTTVISDAPEYKLKIVSSTKCSAPASGATTTTTALAPSPCTSVSLQGQANSPWSPLSVEEAKKMPRSRAEAILDRARVPQGKSGGMPGGITALCSPDLLENAARWGMQIWSLAKLINWLENFKKRYGPLRRTSYDVIHHQRAASMHTRSQSVDTGLQARLLVAPYIKFEVTNHLYKPVCQEFKRFPKLYFTGRPGSSPFTVPDSVKTGARELLRERQDDNRTVLLNQQRLIEHCFTPKLPKPLVEVPQQVLTAAPVATRPQVNRRHQQGGFCEICECPFTDLYDHLSSKIHQHRVSGNDLWAKLDVCIGKVNQIQSEEDECNPELSY